MALTLATYCSPLVHECADWRTDGVGSVLLCLQSLQEALDRVDSVYHEPAVLRSQDDFAEVGAAVCVGWGGGGRR